jgi:hypothetical protein
MPPVTGDIVLIQGADLAYEPGDDPILLQAILDARATSGSNTAFMGAHRVRYFWSFTGTSFLTTLGKMMTNLNLHRKML